MRRSSAAFNTLRDIHYRRRLRDIDGVIRSAAGNRFASEDSADYQLNEAIIEPKLITEEGFEKEERQRKLAELFKRNQPDKPVVILDPASLDRADQREYYNIITETYGAIDLPLDIRYNKSS